jgi:F0F1-type ATP synthase membrane subunit a
MEKICTTLNNVLNSTDDTMNIPLSLSATLKSATITTLTTILIEQDVIHTQPRAFESFVEVLFDIVTKLNDLVHRTLRQTVGPSFLFLIVLIFSSFSLYDCDSILT